MARPIGSSCISDVARLRAVGAFDKDRKPKHTIYLVNKIIKKFVDEVVNHSDPVINEQNRVEHEQFLEQARQRRRHRQRARTSSENKKSLPEQIEEAVAVDPLAVAVDQVSCNR